MGVFIIPPLPPMLSEECRTAGLLRSTDITPLRRYYEPIRHPLVVSRLPGVAGYTAYQLPPFRVGTKRASPVARCVLAPVPSLTTPPERPVASIGLRRAVLPSPSRLRARPPRLLTFGATSRSLSLRPENLRSSQG